MGERGYQVAGLGTTVRCGLGAGKDSVEGCPLWAWCRGDGLAGEFERPLGLVPLLPCLGITHAT